MSLTFRLSGNFAVAILMLFSATYLRSQTTTGTVLGTVTDPSGNVVVGATVTLVNEGSGDQRTGASDGSGGFVFASLLPGTYTVRVESAGFQRLQKTGNTLTANERLSIGNLQLTIGSVAETISVTAQGATVQTASAEGSALLTTSQLDNTPQRGRNIPSMLMMLPGVAQNAGQLETVHGTARATGSNTPAISGLPAGLNTMTLDGLSGMDAGFSDSFTTTVSPDAIAEVKVLLNNYQAEYGRNGGAIINVITKSGTKDYHGSAYWYKRHEMFNANNFFNNKAGLPKERYRYGTEGFALGGPVRIPKVLERMREKLFFFYNLENNPGKEPRPITRLTLPTAQERIGDFSQTLDQNGRLIVIRDPLSNAAFPSNVVPVNRINKSGQALVNIFTLPNRFDRSQTLGAYNYEFQDTLELEKLENLFRLDYRPTDKDSLYFRGTIWESWRNGYGNNQFPTWEYFRSSVGIKTKHGVFGYTRVISPTIVNEFSMGARHPLERIPLPEPAELAKTIRSKVGFTAGQFYPKNNWNDIIPQATFTGIPSPPDFGSFYSARFPQDKEQDTIWDIKDGLTINRNAHTFKVGIFFERNRVISGWGINQPWMGSFNFNRDPNNPFDTNHPYSNAMLGYFQQYTEPTQPVEPGVVDYGLEWYGQDSWKVSNKLTLELGVRGSYLAARTQWDGLASVLSMERYDRSKAPVFYRPTTVGGQRLALNPVTGQTGFQALIGAFVPGTGNPANGMILANDPGVPRGFQESPGEQLQPRFGFAYDVFGNGKTAVRGGFGKLITLNRFSGGQGVPPISYNPIVFNDNLATFLNASTVISPGNVTAVDKLSKISSIYNITLGVQQNIGMGTVVDLKYVSTLGRNLGANRNLNTLPYGTRFLPQSLDPTTNRPLPDNFLRPFPGYANVTYRETSTGSNYHALQFAANRRFTTGLQFGASYTYSKTMDYQNLPLYRPRRVWSYGKADFDQTHMLILNYVYNLPGLSRMAPHPVSRFLFDKWQMSGVTAFTSGTPGGITLTTTDGADLTGGGDGQRVNVTGDPRLSHGERGIVRVFNTAVFARPGLLDPGNAPRDVYRGPGINNWDLTLAKTFPITSEKRLFEFRWEFYNFFNHTQFRGPVGGDATTTADGVDAVARFDPAGNQVNARFGQPIAARASRAMQVSLRFRF
jgi:hypothetical protein